MRGTREMRKEISRPTIHGLALLKSSCIRVTQVTINRGLELAFGPEMPAACIIPNATWRLAHVASNKECSATALIRNATVCGAKTEYAGSDDSRPIMNARHVPRKNDIRARQRLAAKRQIHGDGLC